MHALPITERNRANARHSTGPRTAEGKSIASQNARKHGFTVLSHRILANEDPAAYEAFENEIIEVYAPQSDRERLAATEIARCRWALRRFDDAETALWDLCFTSEGQSTGQTLAGHCISAEGDRVSTAIHSMELLTRYRHPWDRRHQDAIRQFDRARLDRTREERLALAKQREARQQQRRIVAKMDHTTNAHQAAPASAHNCKTSSASGFVSSPDTENHETAAYCHELAVGA